MSNNPHDKNDQISAYNWIGTHSGTCENCDTKSDALRPVLDDTGRSRYLCWPCRKAVILVSIRLGPR